MVVLPCKGSVVKGIVFTLFIEYAEVTFGGLVSEQMISSCDRFTADCFMEPKPQVCMFLALKIIHVSQGVRGQV